MSAVKIERGLFQVDRTAAHLRIHALRCAYLVPPRSPFDSRFVAEQIRRVKEPGGNNNRRTVENGVAFPAERSYDIPANDERTRLGSQIKEIDIRAGKVVTEQIDGKCDRTAGEVNADCRHKITEGFSRPPRREKIQTQKYEDHVPGKGVDRERPIGKAHAFRRKIGDESAHESERSRKRIERTLCLALFQPGNDQAYVHGNTAELERDSVVLIRAFADDVRIKQLFVKFGNQEKKADAENQPTILFFVDSA